MIPRSLRAFALLAGLAGALASQAATVTVVQWGGGDYAPNTVDLEGRESTTAIVDLDGDSASDDTVAGRLFSLTTPMSPVAGYDTGLTSAVFYGGAFTGTLNDTNGGTFWQAFDVKSSGLHDDLHFRTQNDGLLLESHILALWTQPDFLNGADAMQLGLGTNSFFSLDIHNASAAMQDALGRFVVRNGSSYYVSDATFVPENGTHTLTGAILAAPGAWRVYQLTTNNMLSVAFDTNAVSFFDVFTDITGVGFLVDHDLYGNDIDFSVHTFTAALDVVPEPGTALILPALALVAARRRRR